MRKVVEEKEEDAEAEAVLAVAGDQKVLRVVAEEIPETIEKEAEQEAEEDKFCLKLLNMEGFLMEKSINNKNFRKNRNSKIKYG